MGTTKQTQRFCPTCNQQTLHVKTFDRDRVGCVEVLGHSVLTVITLGLWLPIAILWSIYRGGKTGLVSWWNRYHCQKCGRAN